MKINKDLDINQPTITENGNYRPFVSHDSLEKVKQRVAELIKKNWILIGYTKWDNKHVAVMECAKEQYEKEREIENARKESYGG